MGCVATAPTQHTHAHIQHIILIASMHMCVLYEFISARHMLRTCVYTLHSTHIATQLYAAISIDQNVKERAIVYVCAHINVCISSTVKKKAHTQIHTRTCPCPYTQMYTLYSVRTPKHSHTTPTTIHSHLHLHTDRERRKTSIFSCSQQ